MNNHQLIDFLLLFGGLLNMLAAGLNIASAKRLQKARDETPQA